MKWASSFKEKPKRVFVAHGDDTVCDLFAKRLEDELGYQAMAPYSGTEVDLITNEITRETVGIVIKCVEQKAKSRKAAGVFARLLAVTRETVGIVIKCVEQKAKSRKAAGVFARLLAAGQRLMTVIRHNEGGTNKDLAKFADQINSLCDKWDR